MTFKKVPFTEFLLTLNHTVSSHFPLKKFRIIVPSLMFKEEALAHIMEGK
jgi:hypothetical protein